MPSACRLATPTKVSPAARVGWLACLATLLVPLPARGQATVRAITSVSAGGSDNARGRPEPRQKRTTSVFGRSSAEADLGYRGANSNHLLRLALGATGFPGDDASHTFSQEASLASQWTWERGSFEIGAMGSHSALDDMQPLLEGGLTVVDRPEPIVPAFGDQIGPDEELSPHGTIGYLGGSFAEGLALELSPLWTLYHSAGVDMFSAVQGDHIDPPIWTVSSDLGIERAFTRDAVRLEVTAGRETAPTLVAEEGVIPGQEGDFGRLGLGWLHQFTAKWRADLSGGAYAARATQASPFEYGPAWRAALHWRGRQWRTTAMYDRSVQPSVLLGGIFLADRASIRATGLFGHEERFRFRGILRYQRMSAVGPVTPLPPPPAPIDPSIMNPPGPEPEPGPLGEEQLNTVANRWQAQVTLGFVPWHSRLVEVGLTYRLTNQAGATLGRRRLKTLERNVLLLTLTVGFPLQRDAD